ncbi:DUF4249 domain-containing protein [Flavobacterium alkalisoli]|uniref:DUF4249 domain-containing protein n=1 Tax=Flavobacterium alkalisoli TaxID=2602769 RepID=A0A5B9FVJ2_9FLAO|nr:DUF4249 family protein [Flavobacterium alkalisoli]QEE50935.1 DUF4249 domain-containing protein [Flavobacterium alkalisoli]
MRKLYTLLLVFTSLFFTACEDVVDLDLPTAPPRLVVEASFNWMKTFTGHYQEVRLTTTAGFYDTEVPKVSGATVYVTNSKNDVFEFSEDKSGFQGIYACINFNPEIGETYTLFIELNGETFTATETLMPVPQLEEVILTNEGFDPNDMSLKAYFQDPPETNYYLREIGREGYSGGVAIFDDRFVNGNYTYTITIFDDLKPGDEITTFLYGISSRHFDYMSKILSIVDEENVTNPFRTPSINVRGNIVNQTNPDNYALGYFRLSEGSYITYTVE